MHADEATGARILGSQIDSDHYKFDPAHYHGPLLLYATLPATQAAGENTYAALSKSTLRKTTAIAGVLTVAAVGLLWPWLRGVGVLIAATLITVSSIQLYFSRMWIHESIFGLFSILSLAALAHYIRKPSGKRAAATGIAMGLMFATRETVVISMAAWGIAALLVVQTKECIKFVRKYWRHAVIAGCVFLLTAALFYTGFGKNPEGIIDAFRTYFAYETIPGHEKPFGWYLELMLWPTLKGFYWHELPIFLLALVGGFAAFSSRFGAGRSKLDGGGPTSGRNLRGGVAPSPINESIDRKWAKFFVYAAIAHFLIYSLIAYKTPWLMLTPWLHVILLAGYGAKCAFEQFSLPWKGAYALLLVFSIISSYVIAERASGLFQSDARNPYAYSPTPNNMEEIHSRLNEMLEASPELDTALGVIGKHYGPLPWYLRAFKNVGYWPVAPDNLKDFKLLIVMPEQAEAVGNTLNDGYFAQVFGLRDGYIATIFIRNDVWEKYSAE